MKIIQYGPRFLKGITKFTNSMIANPFDINKAVDYTDQDIFKYWVDLNDTTGFSGILKPNTLMPMIIEGSKGSGKTHIMKYYSYELQKIRLRSEDERKLKSGFENENCIGVYIRCSGLNANVFSGKGLDDNTWESIFAFYWELWIGERLLNVLSDMQRVGLISNEEQMRLINAIPALFMKCDAGYSSLEDFRVYLIQLQKELLYEIHNFFLLGKKKPGIEIKLKISDLTYGIPNLLKQNVEYFKKRHVLYLIDEYENFSEQQQQVMMTLLREKPTSCTIRIGTRPYGIRTYYTVGKIEENREGSEYERIKLDEEIREAANYKEYLKNICLKRLQGAGIILNSSFDLDAHIDNITAENIIERAEHIKSAGTVKDKLRNNLQKYKSQILSDEQISEIISLLTFEKDLVTERACFVFLYKRMKAKSKDLIADAKSIHQIANQYINKVNLKDNELAKYLSHYRKDIVDSIARSANIQIPYYGLDSLIELSCGIPRTLLRILKHAFSKQYFNTGKVPFEKNRSLKVESQQAGIESTCDWFFEENRILNDKNDIASSVQRLGSYLQNVRFSDIPPQCSINIFSVQEENMTAAARETLKVLTMYSYIVPHKNRRKRNANNKMSTYKLNTILIPKYELSLEVRGNVELSNKEAEIIFNSAKACEYENFVKNKLRLYNFPFSSIEKESSKATPPLLFAEYEL